MLIFVLIIGLFFLAIAVTMVARAVGTPQAAPRRRSSRSTPTASPAASPRPPAPSTTSVSEADGLAVGRGRSLGGIAIQPLQAARLPQAAHLGGDVQHVARAAARHAVPRAVGGVFLSGWRSACSATCRPGSSSWAPSRRASSASSHRGSSSIARRASGATRSRRTCPTSSISSS